VTAPISDSLGRSERGTFASIVGLEERFWSKTDKNGPVPIHAPELGPCWIWTAAIDNGGYGVFQLRDKVSVRASRLAWELTHGIPLGRRIVRHQCDNPPCCNPAHLLDGTSKDNSADAIERGRLARGVNHGRAKLTLELAQAIRRERALGATQVQLAARYGISRATVRQVLSGRTWRAP
jgi:hypothetical protein